MLWTIWLERTRVIFKGGQVHSVQSLGAQIISTAKFWCTNQLYDALSNLICMIPLETKDLQGGLPTITNLQWW